MNRRTPITLTVIALGATFALAGCTYNIYESSDSKSPSDSRSEPVLGVNAADRMFVMMMIPHHEQAIEMSDIILSKEGVDPRVAAMAQQIKDGQLPEIDLMTSWQDSWSNGEGRDNSMMNGMDHDHMGSGMGSRMGGMLSDGEMDALRAATGSEANQLFLEGMIAHHEGAILMAQEEIDNGENSDVLALCEQIVVTQEEEIVTMREILASL